MEPRRARRVTREEPEEWPDLKLEDIFGDVSTSEAKRTEEPKTEENGSSPPTKRKNERERRRWSSWTDVKVRS